MTTSPAVAVPQLIIRNEPMGLSPGSGASPDEARLSAVDARSSTAAPSGAGSNASSSPPAPSSGNTAPKQETAPAAEEEEVDELRDDDPVVPPPPPPQPRAPAPASAAAPVVPSPKPAVGGGGGSKSRKSSCDLCHHRKIKVSLYRAPHNLALVVELTHSSSVTRFARHARRASAKDTRVTIRKSRMRTRTRAAPPRAV
jgi:hypothetical protein